MAQSDEGRGKSGEGEGRVKHEEEWGQGEGGIRNKEGKRHTFLPETETVSILP
jgi:hypothetical protein